MTDGRKKIRGPDPATVTTKQIIRFTADPAEYRAIHAIATNEGCSIAEAMRQLIRQEVSK